MVEVPVPAAIGEVALTVDWPAETGPAFTTTVAVWVIATALMVADTAFDPAAVELKVPVTTPPASVVPSGCVSVFPAVGVAASVTVAPSIGFPPASRAVTVMVDWLDPLDAVIGEVAVTVDCAADTAPAFTTTVAVCVIATALIVAEIVFDSASVDASVPVATPLAFVVVAGCVSVLPDPVAASTTVAPCTGLPLASRAVTVIVDVPLPAVIGDVAVTVDCAADTVPAFTTTVAVCVIATALIVAEIVFDSARVDASVPVATPLAFVVVAGCVSVLPDPVAASTTVAPGIGLPFASRAVTVIVELPLPAAIGDVAPTVDCAADTGPAFTTTVAVCVMATPSIVAATVFDPAAVELRLPVTTPPASVVPSGCVTVFPAVGVAASVTVAPCTGFPLASRAVTVIVDVPLPAVIGDVALTVDWLADTVPAFTTTVAVCVIATALIVAEIVFDSASVDASVPVATPLAFVVVAGCVSVLPDPVAASTTVAPGMGLPFASRAVTVIVELPLPAAIGDVALTVDWLADTVPAFTTTVAVCVIATALIVAEIVLDSARVDDKVPVATPLAFVVVAGCVSVLPDPVAASTTVAPGIELPFASRAVTVIVDVPLPAVIGDVALTVDWLADTVPAFTTTVAVWVTPIPSIVAEIVLDSASVDASVPVVTPLALVVAAGCVRVLPPPVAASTTVAPCTGLPLASRAVTVIVEVPLPAVIGDVALTVDWLADTAPAFTTTVAVCVIATALIVAEIVFDSASVDASVPVATPLAFVVVAGCVSVLPDPVAASTTVAPGMGLPFPSRAVTVIVELPLPAAIGDVALTVDWLADTVPAFTTTVAVCVIATALIVAEIVFDSASVELKVAV